VTTTARDLNRDVLPYFDGKLRRRVEQVSPRDVAGFVGFTMSVYVHLLDGDVGGPLDSSPCDRTGSRAGMEPRNHAEGAKRPRRVFVPAKA
jgi:hypothetical protein